MIFRRPLRNAALAGLAAVALAVFGASSPARAAELRVAAASSLLHAMEQIGRDFEAAHGTRVRFDFAVADALLTQILDGAPIDVFVPDAEEVMDRAEPLMLAGTRRDIATNRLVVIVAPAAPPLTALADLATSRIEKIAVGNPLTSPLGRYAKGALERTQLWTPLMPKFVYDADVRRVRDIVVRGEAQAGFVYETDATMVGERVRIAFNVPTATPIRYAAAVVRNSGEEAPARAFVQYLRSAPAREVLAHYGFRP